MQIYQVGGAVRDELLGLPIKDRDFVVVGATPAQMLQAGFKAVGKDFPVFLHPKTHEEYALARTERKTAKGYKGFTVHAAPEVTLEEDLSRRDFTINAIAKSESGELTDLFGGQQDIQAKILRHISPAFAEDPVRILRAGRFLARFADFTVAAETLNLMQQMVAAGEVNALVPERVWQEISRGLMEQKPSRMFEMLQNCGALAVLMPEFSPTLLTKNCALIDDSAQQTQSLPVRFAVLTQLIFAAENTQNNAENTKQFNGLCTRLRVPNDCKALAQLALRALPEFANLAIENAQQKLELLMALDAFRQPARFEDFLAVCACINAQNCAAKTQALKMALTKALSIDAQAVAQSCQNTAEIAQAIFAARLKAIG